jgi:hypothetical protein
MRLPLLWSRSRKFVNWVGPSGCRTLNGTVENR